jgi:hypothetical protein
MARQIKIRTAIAADIASQIQNSGDAGRDDGIP